MDRTPAVSLLELIQRPENHAESQIIYADTSIPFQYLIAASHRLASCLLHSGIRAGDTVGLLLERHPDYITAIMACWLAGAVVVPLNPDNPAAYLRKLLINTPVDHLVFRNGNTNTLADLPCNQIPLAFITYRNFEYNNDIGTFLLRPGDEIYRIPAPEKPGSRNPVSVTGKTAQEMLKGAIKNLGINHKDRILAVTPFESLASLFEWLTPLYTGSDLVFLGGEDNYLPDRIMTALNRHSITTVQTTPFIWDTLLSQPAVLTRHIKHALVLGHDLSPSVGNKLYSFFHGFWWLKGFPGASLWDSVKYVTEENLKSGITDQPSQNISEVKHDEGYWPGGLQVFPDWIENILELHGCVRQAAVALVLRQSRSIYCLNAWVVHEHGTPNKSAATLQDYLRQYLPEMMIPDCFHFPDALPEDGAGNKNRGKLAHTAAWTYNIRIQDNEEAELAALFCRILDIDGIGPDDSFFDYGGNSILAASLLMAINTQYGADISLKDLLAAPPTVKRLTLLLERHAKKTTALDKIQT